MARLALIAAALAGMCLLSAPAAFAHGKAEISLAQAVYLPGEDVTVNGVFVDPEFTVLTEPATVILGEEGPVLGRAPIAADGTWTLTFTLPATIELGTYALFAQVLGKNGQSVNSLVARAALQIGPAPAVQALTESSVPNATTPDNHPAALPLTAVSHVPPAALKNKNIERPRISPGASPRALPATRVRAQPTRPLQVRPSPKARRPGTDVPTPPKPSPPTRSASVASPGPPRTMRPPRSIPQKRASHHQARAARPLVRPPTTITPLHHAAPQSETRTDNGFSSWLLAALVLLLGGTAAAGLLLTRRRRPPERPLDPVEAELQGIIFAERARQHEIAGAETPDVREPVGSRG